MMNVYRVGACAVGLAALAIGYIGHHEMPGAFAKAADMVVPARSAQADEHVGKTAVAGTTTARTADSR